jgi:hypothetical protein
MPGAGDAAGKNTQVGRSMDADALAWTALLARWLDYARAAKSLPTDASGARWRGAVEHVITLQALRMALGDLTRVAEPGRPVARDLAAIQIRGAAAGLNALWQGEPLPHSLRELVHDAECALQSASPGAFTELVWLGEGELVMPALDEPGGPDTPGGTLLLMAPGTIALPGEPVAIFAHRAAPSIALPAALGTAPASRPTGRGALRTERDARIEARSAGELAQLYRTFDAAGRWSGSFRRRVHDEVPDAMPMLVPIWAQGERVGRFELPAAEWTAMQRAAGIGMPRVTRKP